MRPCQNSSQAISRMKMSQIVEFFTKPKAFQGFEPKNSQSLIFRYLQQVPVEVSHVRASSSSMLVCPNFGQNETIYVM